MLFSCFINTLELNWHKNKTSVNIRMLKGILMDSVSVEKYFLCTKVLRSKLKFTIYSILY